MAGDEPQLQQERLDHVLQRARVLVHGGGQSLEAHGTALVGRADGLEIRTVELIEAQGVDAFEGERLINRGGRRTPIGSHGREVAHASQQPVGDARRAPAARRDGIDGLAIDVEPQQPRAALDDGGKLGDLVEAQVVDEPEAAAQRRAQQARACRGADEREGLALDLHGAGVEPRVECDVDAEVLHRRIHELLDGGGGAVDLVDEQDVAGLEPRKGGDEVGPSRECRAAGDMHLRAHLGGDDVGQRGLAQAGRAVQQHVVEGLVSGAGGLHSDRQSLKRLALADVFGQSLRTQSPAGVLVGGVGGGWRDHPLQGHG